MYDPTIVNIFHNWFWSPFSFKLKLNLQLMCTDSTCPHPPLSNPIWFECVINESFPFFFFFSSSSPSSSSSHFVDKPQSSQKWSSSSSVCRPGKWSKIHAPRWWTACPGGWFIFTQQVVGPARLSRTLRKGVSWRLFFDLCFPPRPKLPPSHRYRSPHHPFVMVLKLWVWP